MTDHLLSEHNAACERAQLSTCHCFCHGAGHQLDLLKRAVSCTFDGENNVTQLLLDLEDIYGGFHGDFRDVATPSRRKVPDDLAQLNLERGRGATWVETLLLDEALHAAFVGMSHSSVNLSATERLNRTAFVEELAEGALRIVGKDVDAHNISDGHLWCSVLAEALASPASPPPTGLGASRHGRICYPRNQNARFPQDLAGVRVTGYTHIQDTLQAHNGTLAADEILQLMGAASCPDLWHHPGAVRHSLLPFVAAPSWPYASTTALAVRPGFDVLEGRWDKRGNW